MELLRKLHKAVKVGNDLGIRTAVASGADMDQVFGMAGTALCQAIHSGHHQVIPTLIELGCDVNAPDFDGGAPLSLAIRKHQINVALLLMTVVNCDLNKPDPASREPPLCAAVMEDLTELVERLVQDPRCQATARDEDGNSALHLALLHKKYDSMTILARCEGFRFLHNKAGLAPVHIVAHLGDCKAFDVLFPPPAHKEEVFHHTLDTGNAAIGSPTLSTLRQEVNQQCTYTGDTALHLAVRERHTELTDCLIQVGAAADRLNNSGQTALLTACSQKNSNCVAALARRLLQAGSPPNIAGTVRLQQDTLLATQARESSLTPLHVAAAYGNLDLVSLLYDHGGADVNVRDERGRSPLYLALINNAGNVGRFLLDLAGEKVDVQLCTVRRDTFLHAVCHCQSYAADIASHLISLGCPMDVANTNGNLPLHEAISWENVEVAQKLLENGANPSVRGGEGSLPLRLAAMTGNVEVAKLLLSAGADINGHEGHNKLTEEELEEELTPLQEALQSEMQEFAYFLVQAGCDVPKNTYMYGSEDDEHGGSGTDSDLDSEEDHSIPTRDVPEWTIQNLELRSILLHHESNPHSLLKLCLDSVRNCFRSGNPPFSYMASLPLPEKMIDLLFYKTA